MGASDSKIGFKQGIFRLSEERNIAANDPYWTSVRDALDLTCCSETDGFIVLGTSRVV
jgi:hypothetical protein